MQLNPRSLAALVVARVVVAGACAGATGSPSPEQPPSAVPTTDSSAGGSGPPTAVVDLAYEIRPPTLDRTIRKALKPAAIGLWLRNGEGADR